MIILGINAYHGDASAAVMVDGEVVAAVEEERFSRQKHQAGFPELAVRWVLDQVGAGPDDIDHVAVSRNPLANLKDKITWTARHRPTIASLKARASNTNSIMGVPEALAAALGTDTKRLRATFHRVEHHRSHIASAFFCSPYDEATCMSLDGMGDFTSTMWGRGVHHRFDATGSVKFPHSLGIYYTAFTQFLGMPNYGDEYKLMGLSATGEPRFMDELREVLVIDDGDLGYKLNLDYFIHHDKGVDMTWASGSPKLGPMFSEKMIERFGPAAVPRSEPSERDRDLAASVQLHLEEVELELLRRLHTRVPSPRLVLAGGVALNCVVNGRIREETPFEDVWVQPAANDSGTSIGAALWVWNEVLGQPRKWEMTHCYFGPEYGEDACRKALEAAGVDDAKRLDDAELYDFVAERIADGAIVGWYQGRVEMGPRALGNRSIVCDPRRPDMKDILNARIKHREAFRPFAPSILEETVGEWFEDDYPSPYMLMAYSVQPDKRDQVPAITHIDGTGRLQTVTREQNERYYELISAFHRRTGVPILVNTSFNDNEPIVTRPEEAVDCFLRTRMDVLVLGNLVVDRGSSS